jgi:hypothetical protein
MVDRARAITGIPGHFFDYEISDTKHLQTQITLEQSSTRHLDIWYQANSGDRT